MRSLSKRFLLAVVTAFALAAAGSLFVSDSFAAGKVSPAAGNSAAEFDIFSILDNNQGNSPDGPPATICRLANGYGDCQGWADILCMLPDSDFLGFKCDYIQVTDPNCYPMTQCQCTTNCTNGQPRCASCNGVPPSAKH